MGMIMVVTCPVVHMGLFMDIFSVPLENRCREATSPGTQRHKDSTIRTIRKRSSGQMDLKKRRQDSSLKCIAMKYLKPFLLTVICFGLFLAASYSNDDPKSINRLLKDKIVSLIDEPDISHLPGKKYHAEVEFIITRRNQVLVLEVYTNDMFFDEYIKSQLNYRTLKIRGVRKMMPYRLNITFLQP